MGVTMTRKIVKALLLALVASLLVCAPALAYLYRAPLTIVEYSNNAYTMLAGRVTSNNDWLAANGFMGADALDTRVQTLGGLNRPHMVTESLTLTAVAVPAYSQVNLYFVTGESDLTAMDIIVGYGGYFSRADTAGLEPGNIFEFTVDGYVDTAAGPSKSLIHKPGAYELYVSGATDITSVIFNHTSPTGFVDAGVGWVNEPNAYDNNTVTFSNVAAGIAAGNWSQFLELTVGATNAKGVAHYLSTNVPDANDLVDIDLFYGAVWNDFYQGVFSQLAWEYTDMTTMESVTSARFRFYNDAGAAEVFNIHEVDYLAEGATVTAAGIATGEHEIIVEADGANMTITVDTVLEDTAALAGATVIDVDTVWTWMDNSVTDFTQYWTSYDHAVGGALVTRYEPNDMIVGTTLPDREVASNDATITWGNNPADDTLPTGFVDPGAGWNNEANAYDDDITTEADAGAVGAATWTSYLELTIAATDAMGLMYYVRSSTADANDEVDVDLYYSAAWHDVYEGAFQQSTWERWDILTVESVTNMRIRFYNDVGAADVFYVGEMHYRAPGVFVSLASMASAGQPAVGEAPTTPSRSLLPEVGVTDWYQEPAVTGDLLTNPFRPFVTLVSDNTTLTEVQTWRWLGLAVVFLVTVAAIRAVPQHLAIASAAAGVTTVIMVMTTIWPVYALVLLILYAVGGWVSERSPSV